jgi:hypothetical protein
VRTTRRRGEQHLVLARRDANQPVRQLKRGLQRVDQTLPHSVLQDEPVNDHVYVVLLVLGQLPDVVHFHGLTVDAHADESAALDPRQDVTVPPLLASYHRRHDVDTLTGGKRQHAVGHLVDRKLRDLASA